MITFSDEAKFYTDSDKQYTIVPTKTGVTYPTFSNADIESMSLDRSVCCETDITFGSVNSSKLEVVVRSSCPSLIGAKLVLNLKLDNGTALKIGEFFVKSDEQTAEITKRKITAFDALNSAMNADASQWWLTQFPSETSSKTVKQLRDAFASAFGLTQKTQTLVNDSEVIVKPAEGEISGLQVLKWIGQLNGAFVRVNNEGLVEWKTLGSSVKSISNSMIQQGAKFASYESKGITQLKLRETEDDTGVVVGSSGHMYTITGNVLTYGMDTTQKTRIANVILTVIKNKPYVPCDFKMRGNLCLEAGDMITVSDGSGTFNTIIMQSKVTLGQSIVDNVVANGNETRSSSANSAAEQIERLRQRSFEIRQTLEGIEAEITQMESEFALKTELQALAGTVDLKVSKTDGSGTSNAQWNMDATTGITMDTHGTTNGIALKSNGSTVLEINRNAATFSGTVYANDGVFNGTIGAAGIKTVDGDDSFMILQGGAAAVNRLKASGFRSGEIYSIRSSQASNYPGTYMRQDGVTAYNKANTIDGGLGWYSSDGMTLRAPGTPGGVPEIDIDINSSHALVRTPYSDLTVNANGHNINLNGNVLVNGSALHDMACGSGTINSNAFTHINFGKTFASIPKVVATYVQSNWPSGQIGSIKINNLSTSGFDATVSGSWSGDVGIDWIAMI